MTIEPISIRKQPWCRWWRGGQRQLNMDSLVPPLPARSQYMRGPFVLWTVRSKHNSFQSLYGQFGPSLQCNPPKERHMSIFGLEKRTVLLGRREYGINSTFLNPPLPAWGTILLLPPYWICTLDRSKLCCESAGCLVVVSHSLWQS